MERKSILHMYMSSIKVKLLILPLVMVLLALSIVGFVSNVNTKESIINELDRNGQFIVEEFVSKIDGNKDSQLVIEEMIEEDIRIVARTVMRLGKTVNSEQISELAEDFGVEVINYFNQQGIVIYSTIPDYVPFVPNRDHPLHAFLKGPEMEQMEAIRLDEKTNSYYKYGTVKNPDGSAVQVGIPADSVIALTAQFESQKLLEDLAKKDEVVFASFLNQDMIAIAHSDEDKIGSDYSENKEIHAVLIDGMTHASETVYGDEDTPVYDLSIPVERDGQITGAMNIGFSMESVNETIAKNYMLSFLTGAVAALIIGVGLFIPSHSVIGTVTALKEQLNTMSSGDFSKTVSDKLKKKKDEFGQLARSMDSMQSSVKGMINNVSTNSTMLAAHAEQLTATTEHSSMVANEVSQTIESIATGAAEQAKNTEEGFQSISQLGQVVTGNRSKLEDLNLSLARVNQLKDEGTELISDLLEKTRLTNQVAGEIKHVVNGTNESAERISEASQMIRNIAEQTKLLALNASIEASRAGEAGRGFAVVAEEIRKLSEQSNRFTLEIGKIIQGLSNEASSAVKTMNDAEEIVNSQSISVNRTSEKFDGIADSIEDMEKIVLQVNQSSEEMTLENEKIARIMGHLAAVSEENAFGTEEASASVDEQTAAMEEISSSSAELAKIAEELNTQVDQFKI